MIHVKVGVAHSLSPRYLTEHRVTSEVMLPTAEPFKQNAKVLDI
jgi:hypothetical protein